MKTKKYIIISLSAILIVISALFICGVGTSHKSLIAEEQSAYNNRKEYSELNSPVEKASYAIGMSRMNVSKYLDGKDSEFLAPFYQIITKPEDGMYYIGQGNIPPAPLNLKTWLPNQDMPLNVESFIAGYAQAMEQKILVPELAGEEGRKYLERLSGENVDTEEVVEVVVEDTVSLVEPHE